MAVLFLVTAVALGLLSRWGISRGVFDIRTVRITGCRYGDPLEILRVAAPELGRHLFGDHRRVAGTIEKMPLIRRADVDRIPPDRVVIRVVEREPVALLAGEVLTPIDGEGWLLPIPPEMGTFDLPVIEPGEPVEPDAVGRVGSESVLRLLEFLNGLRKTAGDLVRNISVLAPDGEGGFRLTTVDRNRRILFAGAPTGRELRLLREVSDELDRKGVGSCTVDLRYRDQVVVH
jgi:cell division septal protein FtsQ